MSIKTASKGMGEGGGGTGGCYGQTGLGSFSLLSVKVIGSIIHSSVCHIAVSLTLKLPGVSERQKYKCSPE